jgi:type IV pilus assembly protein PilX
MSQPITRAHRSGRPRERGAVLFVALILLLILTLIGVTAARMQTVEERMALNEDNHQLAVQAAEAALRDAEANIVGGNYAPSDFSANANGLYELASEVAGATACVSDAIDWSAPCLTPLVYTGPALSSVPASPQATQVIIESLPPVAPTNNSLGNSANYGTQQTATIYRITAHAVGGDATSGATLQSIFH